MPGDHGDLYGLRIQTEVPTNVAPGTTVVWIDTSVHPHPVKCVHRDAAGLETVHEAGGATAEQVGEVVAQLGLATPEDLAGFAQAVHAHTEYATPAEVDSAILAATSPLTGLLGHTHTGTYAPASHALDGASHSGVGVLPTQGQKNALAGTQGTPGTGNEYVTTQDARNTNARTPTAHTHAEADVTGLVADLAAKAPSVHTHAYAATVHGHAIADTTNLQTTLDGKAATNHGTHLALGTTAGTAAEGSHTHAAGAHPDLAAHDTLGLATQAELDTKAASNHTHVLADADIPAAIARDAEVTSAIATHAATPHGGSSAPVYATPAGPALALDVNAVVKMTPSATVTYTTAVPAAGSERVVILLQSNTTAKTITFGAGFKPTATLVLGTTANRVFVVRFVSDGTSLYEASRTAAITA